MRLVGRTPECLILLGCGWLCHAMGSVYWLLVCSRSLSHAVGLLCRFSVAPIAVSAVLLCLMQSLLHAVFSRLLLMRSHSGVADKVAAVQWSAHLRLHRRSRWPRKAWLLAARGAAALWKAVLGSLPMSRFLALAATSGGLPGHTKLEVTACLGLNLMIVEEEG